MGEDLKRELKDTLRLGSMLIYRKRTEDLKRELKVKKAWAWAWLYNSPKKISKEN